MKNILVPVILILLLTTIKAQVVKEIQADEKLNLNKKSRMYGDDVAILSRAPIGRISGVQNSEGKIYVAANDTTLLSPIGLRVRVSTNQGASWIVNMYGLTPKTGYGGIKLISPATENLVYAVVSLGDEVRTWEVTSIGVYSSGITNFRSFDVGTTAAGTFYLVVDSAGTIYRYASLDRGQTWINKTMISATGCYPKLVVSAPGNMVGIIFYSGGIDNHTQNELAYQSYNETAPGELAMQDERVLGLAGVIKTEIGLAMHGSDVWITYTVFDGTSYDVKGIYSSDYGSSFSLTKDIFTDPTRDEYWADVAYYNRANSSFVFLCYSDFLQSGDPTQDTDGIYTKESDGEVVSSTATLISNHIPFWSEYDFRPKIIPLLFSSTPNAGVIWVGLDAGGASIYWDDILVVPTSVEKGSSVPTSYSLEQNYPNPFNPTTTISYTLPKAGHILLKVYDTAGREVAQLVNQEVSAGSHTVKFDGKNLASGVYYYRIICGEFNQTRKFVLLK